MNQTKSSFRNPRYSPAKPNGQSYTDINNDGPTTSLKFGNSFASSITSHLDDKFLADEERPMSPIQEGAPQSATYRSAINEQKEPYELRERGSVSFDNKPPQTRSFVGQYFPTNDDDNKKIISQIPGSLQMASKLKKVLLPSTGYGKFGSIKFRSDRSSMLFKKWVEGCWLHVYPAKISLFNSMEEMRQWKDLNDEAEQKDAPIDSRTARMMTKLVKASIDFDTTGNLLKKMRKLEAKNRKAMGEGSDLSGGSRSLKQKKVSDADTTLPVTYIMEDVRSKYYKKNDPLMHTFKVSYLGLGGRHVTAAFGSSEPQEVKRLRAVVRHITKLTKKATKKRSKKKGGADGDTLSAMLKVPHSARSEITALSNTVYGRNTMSQSKHFKKGRG